MLRCTQSPIVAIPNIYLEIEVSTAILDLYEPSLRA